MRKLKYKDAISEGLVQCMEHDSSIFITGIGVDYSGGIFGTTTEALKQFGPERVFESPAMENALTGICIGAAAMGKRPVIVHARNDFMFLALDQLINLAAKWRYMFGGNAGNVPIVVRAIIGQGWGQGATHSQNLASVLGHFPGLRVAMPATSADAKSVIIAALTGDDPTIILEHRALYEVEGPMETVPHKLGDDLTIVATSSMVREAVAATEKLADYDIGAEVIDPLWIRPLLSKTTILESARQTGHLIIADGSWELCGFASEIAAMVAEEVPGTRIRRITWPNCPCPVSHELEKQFYPNAQTIVDAAIDMLKPAMHKFIDHITDAVFDKHPEFTGPY